MNFLDVTYLEQDGGPRLKLKDGTLIALPQPVKLKDGANATLGIRPEHVHIENSAGLTTDVDLVEPTGFGIILHLSLHGLPFKIFTLDRDALHAQGSIQVSFPAQHLHLFDREGNRVESA